MGVGISKKLGIYFEISIAEEEEVVSFHREPEVRIYLPRQQNNYLEHKRE